MDDDLNMLVIDINTLKPVNPLNLTDDIILNRTDTLDLQYVMRIYRTLSQLITGSGA